MANKKGSSDRKGESRVREVPAAPAEYYSRYGVLGEIQGAPVEFTLNEELREQVIEGRRLRRLLDPAQIIALKKIAAMKSIPYQTLIRQWLAKGISRELRLAEK